MGDIFGVGAFVTQRSGDISRLLIARARELGTSWVREEFTASRLHTATNGRYDWKSYDGIVNQERKGGLRILGLLDYSNTWAYGDHGNMPHSSMKRLTTDFAAYVYAVARHFRGRVSYWQIWNEPNLPTFWHPEPEATDYASLLSAASRAVRRADPGAHVVLAGMSGMDVPFIRDVAGQTRNFDVVAVHPYRNLPESSLAGEMRALRALHRPVWFSEIGWPAGDGCDICYDETEQARYLVRFYSLAAAFGVQRVFWYDLRDDAHTASNPEAHFGLLRRDLSGKPAFLAYAYLAHLLSHSTFTGADSFGRHGNYILRFRRKDAETAVVWNASDDTRQVSIRWSSPEAVLVNAGGDVLAELTPVNGRVTITAPQGGEPFYLLDAIPAYRAPSALPLLHFPPPPPPTPARTRPKRVARRRTELRRGVWIVPVVHRGRARRSTAEHRREHVVRVSPRPVPLPAPTPTTTPTRPTP